MVTRLVLRLNFSVTNMCLIMTQLQQHGRTPRRNKPGRTKLLVCADVVSLRCWSQPGLGFFVSLRNVHHGALWQPASYGRIVTVLTMTVTQNLSASEWKKTNTIRYLLRQYKPFFETHDVDMCVTVMKWQQHHDAVWNASRPIRRCQKLGNILKRC